MKILIAAIGKAKPGPERELYADYIKRLPWKIAAREFDCKLQDTPRRKAHEAELLLSACQPYGKIIALDESGALLSSPEFARQLAVWQQQGISSFAFAIGGSDGLDAAFLKRADLAWSLGRVTWPHMLARALLAEQLYRAYTLLQAHPYHRT